MLARMQLDIQSICAEQNQNQYYSNYCTSNLIGCYVATANSTQFSQNGSAATCEKMPFREIAHTITSYALNGSNMHVEFSFSRQPPFPYNPPSVEVTLRIELPNSWFVQTAVALQYAINALPADLWQTLKLGDTMPGPEGTPVHTHAHTHTHTRCKHTHTHTHTHTHLSIYLYI